MATYKSIRYIVPAEAVEHTDSINALSDVDTNTTAPTDGQILKWNNTNSKWYPGDVEEAGSSPTQKAIFGFGSGYTPAYNYTSHNETNLVSSTGVVASNTTGVGTERGNLAAAGYGGDKAIFGFGRSSEYYSGGVGRTNITNLVSNTGVVASDTTGVGTARDSLTATGYGGDKAIFGFGDNGSTDTNVTNLVSNAGVVATDTTGVGTAREGSAASGYGSTGQAIFGFGRTNPGNNKVNTINLVSSTGVVATDTTAVGTARDFLAAAGYGGDKAIFGFGNHGVGYPGQTSMTNLVSNTGVVASDTTGVGTIRNTLAAASYGGDKAIFGFGHYSFANPNYVNMTNLVSNTGVVSSDTTGVGLIRDSLAAAGYSTTA